jgi:hypothetical protein
MFGITGTRARTVRKCPPAKAPARQKRTDHEELHDVVPIGNDDVGREGNQGGHQSQAHHEDLQGAAGGLPTGHRVQLPVPDGLGPEPPLPLGAQVQLDKGTGGGQLLRVVLAERGMAGSGTSAQALPSRRLMAAAMSSRLRRAAPSAASSTRTVAASAACPADDASLRCP